MFVLRDEFAGESDDGVWIAAGLYADADEAVNFRRLV
jgi:hypothetical protein